MKGARMDNDLKIQRKKRLDAACVPDFSRKFNPYEYMEEINLSELCLRITEGKKTEEEQRARAREFLLIKDEWSDQEVIDLFSHDEVSLMSLIRASINAGKLKFLRKYETLYGEPEVYYFEPLVITKWIISKKIPLPNDVRAWYNEQTKQTEERKEEQQIEQVQLKTQSEAPPVKQTDDDPNETVAALFDPMTQSEAIPVKQTDDDPDKTLSALFDLVPVESLEKMFTAAGRWKKWAEKAKSNGLIVARVERAMFNPYIAGKWFVRKGQDGWDDARLNRVLANNLPARSRDEKHQLTGEIN